MQHTAVGVIIVAAGQATRCGFAKQVALLNGLPLFLHSVRTFLPLCDRCIIVTPKGQENAYRQMAAEAMMPQEKMSFTAGGATRTESVLNGLDALDFDDGIVAIHDAARPLTTAELFLELVDTAMKYDGAAPAHPASDTLLVANDDHIMTGICPREHVWHVSTPQVFNLRKLRLAYAHANGQPFTDDTQVFFHDGNSIHLVPEQSENLKVTFPEDLERVRQILQFRNRT